MLRPVGRLLGGVCHGMDWPNQCQLLSKKRAQDPNIPACTSPLCYIPCFSNFRRCAAPGSFRDAPTQKIPSPAGRMAHAHASRGKEHVFNCSRLRVIKCIIHTHCPRPVGHCEAKLLKPLQTRHAASCRAAHLDIPSGGCSCGQLGSEIPSLLACCIMRTFTGMHRLSRGPARTASLPGDQGNM